MSSDFVLPGYYYALGVIRSFDLADGTSSMGSRGYILLLGCI